MKDVHVTIYHVAARAGVSASTASRALAGLNVNKRNLAAVEAAAAELGYVANEAARSLRMVKTMTVGMVFDQLTSPLGMELLGSLSSSLDAMGYSLFISTALGEQGRYDKLVRRFLERRVDALLCVHGHGGGEPLKRYASAGIPALSLISSSEGYGVLPLVSDSIEKASADCVRALFAQGHRRIGVVAPRRPVHLIPDFMAAAGDAAVLVEGRRDEEGRLHAEALLTDLASRADAPTALVALHADAVNLMAAAGRMGLAIPASLSLVAIRDRSFIPPDAVRSISIIHVDPKVLGARVAAILGAWLETGEAWTGDLRVDTGAWIDKGTIGPAPLR